MRHRTALLGLLVVATGVSACTESYGGGEACPVLCPSKSTAFLDTIIDAVSLDSTVGGYPELGLSPLLLLANRPDTLETLGVVRFDVLPTSYLPNSGSTSEAITAIDSVYLLLQLDTTGARGTEPVTLEAFDVDTTAGDSSQVVLKTLYRADRRVGVTTITPSTVGDTLRVPLSKAYLQMRIDSASRVRLGLKLSGAAGQVRIVAFQLGTGAPFIRFDPSTDTTYAPISIAPTTSLEGATSDVNLAYTVYGITIKGSTAPDATTLQVGGFPAYRSYLRFNLPKAITDSSTIVRAEVLLTQRPSAFGSVSDSVYILPLVPTSTDVVTDMRRILDLSADGIFAALDSTAVLPSDAGVKIINILRLARSWAGLPTNVPRAIAFRINDEGSQPAELRFYSRQAAANLRPRVRITYLPRTQNAIP